MVRPYSLEGAEISSPPNRFPYEKPWFLHQCCKSFVECLLCTRTLFFIFLEKKIVSGEFSDSPRVRISHFHYWDLGSIPDWGIKVLRALQYAPPSKKKKKIMFLISLLPLGSSGPSGRFSYNYRTMPYYRAPNKTRMLIVTTTPHKS